MRVLVTGAGGMLARALAPRLERHGMEVCRKSRAELDVTDHSALIETVQESAPDVIVQCAAYTDVDKAEDEEDRATEVNATATGYLAQICQRSGILLVYPSTDYVFSGTSSRPYRPPDPVAPLGAYGRSKVAGEAAARRAAKHLIVRTSWLYGAGGRNFVDTISRLAKERDSLSVVDDQIGLPTWTASLSEVLVRLLKVGAVGTFHAADGGPGISWFQLAKRIVELRGVGCEVLPISTREFGAKAARPRYSVLDCSTTEQMIGERLPDREHSLASYLLN